VVHALHIYFDEIYKSINLKKFRDYLVSILLTEMVDSFCISIRFSNLKAFYFKDIDFLTKDLCF